MSSKPQAQKRRREFYRTAQDRSTRSRQEAHRAGQFQCETRTLNPFRCAQKEHGR